MSTLLQLLANYYKSVIESERLYYDNANKQPNVSVISSTETAETSHRMAQEMLMLQRQVGNLTVELQALAKENDTLKELQKTQKALMESKLNNCKKTIEKLKTVNQASLSGADSGGAGTKSDRVSFHLLSPLNVRTLDGVSRQNHHVHSSNKPTGLRHVIMNGQPTLFDGDDSTDDPSLENLDDVVTINFIKNKDKLANIVLPKDLSENEDSQDRSNSASFRNLKNLKPGKKRRKLARNRVKTGHSESESEN